LLRYTHTAVLSKPVPGLPDSLFPYVRARFVRRSHQVTSGPAVAGGPMSGAAPHRPTAPIHDTLPPGIRPAAVVVGGLPPNTRVNPR